jgi:phosphoribosylglycinamide formyltransferase-1
MNSLQFKIVVLISGNGTNLQAIIDAIRSHQLAVKILAVISDNAEAYGLKRAELNHIPFSTILKTDYKDRQSYDLALSKQLKSFAPDLVILAGFMRILGKALLHEFKNKIINIHPSLLPKYPGLDTHRQVLREGACEHGCSIHFVNENVDAGPLIAQVAVKVMPEDSETSLIERVHRAEHFLYPTVINWFANNRIAVVNNQVYLDNIPLTKAGLRFEMNEKENLFFNKQQLLIFSHE